MNKLLKLFTAGAFLLSLPGAKSFAQQPTFASLDYTGRRDLKQSLDLYVPTGLTSPAPLAIYIHGGEWRFGNKGIAIFAQLFKRG